MVLEGLLVVALILFILLSLVLEHHWRSHANHSRMLFAVRLFYYGGSLFFFVLLIAAFMIVV